MYQNPQSMFNPYSQNIAIIKDYFKKPIVLATAIVSAIVTIATFATSIFSASYMHKIVIFLSAVTNEPFVYSANPSSAAISTILPVLTTIAFFIIYSKSNNDDPYSNPVNGVSILSVISLIQLIFIIFSIMGTTGLASLVYFMTLGVLSPEIIILLISTAATLALSLVFYINQYRFYRNIKNGLTSITLSKKGAGAFGVVNIIYSAIGFLGSCIMLMPLFLSDTVIEYPNTNASLDLKDIMPLFITLAVITLLTAAQYTLIAIIALGYKKYINKIANSFNSEEHPFVQQPYFTQTPYQPATAVPFNEANSSDNYPMPVKEDKNPYELSADEKNSFENYRSCDDTIECPYCKKHLPKEIVFCDSCGNKVQ